MTFGISGFPSCKRSLPHDVSHVHDEPMTPRAIFDRARLAQLHGRELASFRAARPRSAALAERARAHMPGGVPMSWMVKWPGEFPVFVEHALWSHDGLLFAMIHVFGSGNFSLRFPERAH